MSIYLHAYSSLPVLYAIGSSSNTSAHRTLHNCSAVFEEYSEEDRHLRRLGLYDRPLHVLVNAPERRLKNQGVVSHVWRKKFPAGSLIPLDKNLFISSPQFCFLQLANTLDMIDLIRFGYELCSLYCLDSQEHYGFREASPLLTKKKLTDYLSHASNVPGSNKARRALRWVRENSRSPRETALSMILSLPTQLGGWQLGEHMLNYELHVDFDIEGYLHRFIDLYWPKQKVGLEYDSDAFHFGEVKTARDSVREKVITEKGIRMTRMTNSELMDPIKLEFGIGVLAQLLGFRPRDNSNDIKARRRSLSRRLLLPHEKLW